uniref:Tc3 transposase DNA binding domain-containing protein n=1 Tax=Octopus bimaculoides TaxID=37653 RepID=A0A0L8HSF9_OCTBM
MSKLTRNEREQAIGRLHADQCPWVIANDFNCSIRTSERLRERYNAKNSTDYRPRMSRSPSAPLDTSMVCHKSRYQPHRAPVG